MFTGNRHVDAIADGLANLDEAEIHELDTIITPRAAQLLTKAFGPEMGLLTAPLTANDPPEERRVAEQELRRMMRDPRYWRDRDPQTMDRISKGFQQLYPES